MDDLRKEKRAPILLKVKYKSASVDEFIQQSGLDISRGGIFIKTKTPMELGTVLKFEFQLSDGAPVIHGVGRVAWRRTLDVATRDLPPGMGVKFIKLDPESRAVVDRTVSQRGPNPSRYDSAPEEPSGAHENPVAASKTPSVSRTPSISKTPSAPTAASPAAASALNPRASNVPQPPGAKATGARPAPPGVFSGTPGGAFSSQPKPKPAASAFGAAEDANARNTVPTEDPFAAAGAPDSFFPKGPPATPPASEDSTQMRHVSEFLASVMNEAGASDQAVAAEAQAGAAKARVKESQVEEQRLGALEAQLFGDMGEQTVSVPLRPVSLSPKAAVEKDFDPFAPDTSSASPELQLPPATPQTSAAHSMRASLSASSKEAVTGRQQDFGIASSGASEGKFSAPTADALPALPASKSTSNVMLPLLVVVALLGGGAYWYFQLGGAQMVAGGAAPVAEPLPTPEPAPEATPEPAPVAPTPSEPAPSEATPGETTAVAEPTTEPTAPPAAAVMVDLQITAVPKDALVSVDGVDQGKAPKKVKVAVGSTVQVTAKAFGYKPMTQTVTVAAKNDPLRFNLETMSFVLTVTTTPSDAHVLAGNFTGDNQTPMDLGYLGAPLTVTVTKSGWAKKQKRVTPDMFTEQDGRMVAALDVGLQRTGPAPAAEAEPAPSSDPEPAPTPKPTPRPDPAPEAAPTPAPTPKPEPRPEPAPSPAALPDNPF